MDVLPALTATTFLRHNRPLRALMIDNQPWFVGTDVARLIGLHHPTVLARRLEEDEVREVRLLSQSGNEEPAEVISEPALYKALYRHSHPENRTLGRWFREEVIPLLRDQYQTNPHQPRRMRLVWLDGYVNVLDWQGEVWVPLDDLPTFTRIEDKPNGPRGFWKR
ncbi:BRO family protein [Pseudomonas sp. DP-17]|uniref:BRO-N domain-containing protein n=1 Tax=Pseudomonas sp. DP-17 TaxID=1580486 RepID=UPI001EFC0ACE|nr:BRO family protein [Pseudomonas sp. DP-17]MCG8907928.1 phage antirepressor [Pseudomonas sp. DP-17]